MPSEDQGPATPEPVRRVVRPPRPAPRGAPRWRAPVAVLGALVLLVGAVVVVRAVRDSGADDVAASETSTTVPATASTTTVAPTTTAPTTTTPPPDALPSGSGEGRRVVFSVSGQRMWWVDADGTVLRTNLVS